MTGLSPVEQITVTDVSMDLVLTCAVNTWSRRAVIYVWISIHKTMNYFIYMYKKLNKKCSVNFYGIPLLTKH